MGSLLVFADLHGNAEDFCQLRRIFQCRRQRDPGAQLVLLGDLVHGPDARAGQDFPSLYGYPDRSWEVVQGVLELQRDHPHAVHLVLGNHDWGHVGGPHTHRFHDDEVVFLERGLERSRRQALRALFGDALLLLVAPCGVLLAHGSPGDQLREMHQLESLSLEPAADDQAAQSLLGSILTSYGQRPEVSDALLATVSHELGLSLKVVIHGHDRDEEGWFAEHHNQLCPVIFGAPRENKRYLELDLARFYGSVEDLQEGHEIRRLYG